MIHNDQLEMIGSRRIYLTGLFELHTLGLLDVERYPKCHACRLSDRWRDIGSVLDAKTASAVVHPPRFCLKFMSQVTYGKRVKARDLSLRFGFPPNHSLTTFLADLLVSASNASSISLSHFKSARLGLTPLSRPIIAMRYSVYVTQLLCD